MNQTYGFLWILALFLLAGDLCFGGRHESQLRIGKALNIFVRYGFLSISIKTIANNQTERWLFKEPTRTIFKDLRPLIETKEEDETSRSFHGDFHMEFCDNHRQLYQAYFRDFTIERLNKPWEAFTGGWHPDVAAKKLGINASFISAEYSYVLVRIVRFRETGKLKINIPPNQPLSADVAYGVNSFQTGNLTNTVKFMESFGTHYINSYITGNSLYQVFVFSRKVYKGIKDFLKSKGGFEKTHVTSIFSPLIADHMGQIRTASGNTTVERWARQIFQCNTSRFSYVALPKLYGNATLLRSVDKLLGNEAVLQMDLKSVDTIFSDVSKQKFFIEVLDNYLKLWEVNMGQSKR